MLYDQEKHATNSYYAKGEDVDELAVICPPHTTERKLMTKIDWKVIPILSIMYLLAFLDRYDRTLFPLLSTI